MTIDNYLHILDSFARVYAAPDLTDGLSPNQYKLCVDDAARIAADCGRRSGKTTALGRKLLITANNSPAQGEDDSILGYLVRTKDWAKRLMWGRLQTLTKQHHLPVTFHHTDMIARHQNGCQVWILGADKEKDIDKLRGFAYRLIVIDEAQSIGMHIEDLADEVLDPALADYDGQLMLAGTPNAACVGFFHDACTGELDGWSKHHWTVLNNPYFPLWRKHKNWQKIAQAWLEAKRQKKGWDEHHPTYLREWMGQWVRDEGGLVYRYNDKNFFDELPSGFDWQHVLGADLGYDDPFAMVVWAFCEDLPDLYAVDCYKKTGLTVSDWADLIRAWQEKHKPVKTVADTGGLGKAIVEEIKTRHGLDIEAAEKKDKMTNIELMNSGFAKTKVWIKKGSLLEREMRVLQWDEDRKKEDPRFPNDVCDAGLYGFREATHWAYQEPEKLPDLGTDAQAKWLADKLKKERLSALAKRKKRGY